MPRLGINQYGKAETHLVRVMRDSDTHEVRDLLVSVALSGELSAVHLEGDNSAVLATDTQKNTVYAFAKEHGVGTPEEFAAILARHFVGGAITQARVEVREVTWSRLGGGTRSCRRIGRSGWRSSWPLESSRCGRCRGSPGWWS